MSNVQTNRGCGVGRPWVDADVERLREMFTEGISQRRIASLLGRTKNSVASKMKQLRLVRGPLIQPNSSNKNAVKRGKPTLPPLRSLEEHK